MPNFPRYKFFTDSDATGVYKLTADPAAGAARGAFSLFFIFFDQIA